MALPYHIYELATYGTSNEATRPQQNRTPLEHMILELQTLKHN